MCMACPRMEPAQRSDVDDSPVCRAQMWQSFTRNQKRASRVCLEYRVPSFEGEGIKRGRIKDCGVVYKNVEPAEAFDNSVYGGSHRCFRTHITLYGERFYAKAGQVSYCSLRLLLRRTIGDGDIRASTGQSQCDLAPNPLSASCHKGGFAVQM
jgi:hypothetical protein